MARHRRDRDKDAKDNVDAEEASAARDALLARLAIARSRLAGAAQMLDDVIAHFDDPDDDKKGEQRSEMLEAIDDVLGLAASAIQRAQGEFKDIDPTEGEEDNQGD